MKRLIVSLLAIAVWALPIHAASALETKGLYESISINYAQHHRSPVSKTKIAHRAIPKSPQGYTGRRYPKEEVQDLIRSYSAEFHISADVPLCIAKLESGYNQFSLNKSSSASGVFQYLPSTWRGTDEGKFGLSVWDADANIRAAIKYMSIHHSTKPWVTASRCPSLKIN